MSEDVLSDVGDELNNVVFVRSDEPLLSEYCVLFNQETSESVTVKIQSLHQNSATEHDHQIYVSPTTLHNLTKMFHQDKSDLLNSRFSFKICDKNCSPSIARSVKIQALNNSLTEAVPLDMMDQFLLEYFDDDRYVFNNSVLCIDLQQHLTSQTVAVSPLLKHNSRVYFNVEVLDEEDDDDDSQGYIIKKNVTRLVQGSNISDPAPAESVLTNFSFNISRVPRYFSDVLENLSDIISRYRRTLSRLPGKSCLRLIVSGAPGSGVDVVCEALSRSLGLDQVIINSRELVGDTSGSSEALIKRIGTNNATKHNMILVLEDLEVLVHNKDGNFDDRAFLALQETLHTINNNIVIIGQCHNLDKLNSRVASLFLHHLEMSSLTGEDRQELLSWLVEKKRVIVDDDIDWSRWSRLTSGFCFADLGFLLDFAQDALEDDDDLVREEQLLAAMTAVQAARSDSLGLATVPSVR